MKKIKFQLASSAALINYLKRFSSLNKRLLLEVDFDLRKVGAKTSNDNRSIVKSSTVSLGDIFQEDTLETLDKQLLIGMHDIGVIMSILGTMSDPIEMTVSYEDYDNNYIASEIKFSSPHVTITVLCLNYKLFKHITNDIYNNAIISLEDNQTSFVFEHSNIDKTIKLLSLDLTINSGVTDTAELAQLVTSTDGIHLQSDQINYLVSESYTGADEGAKFNKSILMHLDKGENQKVTYDTEKVIFSSDNSDTSVIIGQSE